MNEETIRETDGYVAWPSATNIGILELLFPGWVICRCASDQRPIFLSRNSAAFFGMPSDELVNKTPNDLLRLIHPDDVEPYQRIAQRIREIRKSLSPVELTRHRFTIQYRLRRRNQYVIVHEERIFQPDANARLTNFTLFRDLSAERVFTRVQLDWYRVHELGYQRINSYVPAVTEGELTAREAEVVGLIQIGLSSKEIASQLSISINTVRNHRSNLFRKTHARNVIDLVRNTARLELVN